MSHGGGLVPYISSYTGALSEAGTGKVFSVSGFGLSLGTRVDLGSLGTETGRSFSKTSATAGTLSITLTVAALPGSPAAVAVKIRSSGGQVAQGPDVSASGEISVFHGWTPIVLCTGDHDYWWNPDSLNATLSDGDAVSSFTDSANGLALTESEATHQPTFKDSNYVWSGTGASEKKAAAIAGNSLGVGGLHDVVIPLDETGGIATACTVACVMTDPLNNGLGNNISRMQVGVSYDTPQLRFALHIKGSASYGLYPGQGTTGNGASRVYVSYTGGILMPAVTASNGAGKFTIPELSIDETFTYTANNPSPTTQEGVIGRYPAYVGEVLILSKEISDTELAQLRSYWANKYGS